MERSAASPVTIPGTPRSDGDALVCVQVWNTNKHTGLVGVFHLQGAAWSRRKRQFLIHDATPPPLATVVRVADVEPLLAAGSPADRWTPPAAPSPACPFAHCLLSPRPCLLPEQHSAVLNRL